MAHVQGGSMPPQAARASTMDTKTSSHIIITITFSVLAALVVILRFWSRKIQHLEFELSDYLIIPGLIFALASDTLGVYDSFHQTHQGHTPADMKASMVYSMKGQLAGPLLWAPSVTFIRASIITLYMRIFSIRRFIYICYTILIINAAFCLGTILADFLICHPVAYRWDRTIPGGECGIQQALDMFIAVFNFLLDVTVVIMPMPILWSLQMTVQKKVALTGMFGMGTVICALTLYRISVTATIDKPENAKEAYDMIKLLAALESLFGIISACLPMLRPFIVKMKPLFIRRSGSDSSNVSDSIGPLKKGVQTTSGSIPILFQLSRWRKSMSLFTTKNHGGADEEAADWEKEVGKARNGDPDAHVQLPELKKTGSGRVDATVKEINVRKDVDVSVQIVSGRCF